MHALPKFHRTCSNKNNNALVIKEGNGLKQYLRTKITWSMQESIFKNRMTNSHLSSQTYYFSRIFFKLKTWSKIHEPSEQKLETQSSSMGQRVNSGCNKYSTTATQDVDFISHSFKILIYLLWLKSETEWSINVYGKWKDDTSKSKHGALNFKSLFKILWQVFPWKNETHILHESHWIQIRVIVTNRIICNFKNVVVRLYVS